jgi:hypothetical protein
MTYFTLFYILLVQTVPSLLTKCFWSIRCVHSLTCCGINGHKQSNEGNCFPVYIVHNLFNFGFKALGIRDERLICQHRKQDTHASTYARTHTENLLQIQINYEPFIDVYFARILILVIESNGSNWMRYLLSETVGYSESFSQEFHL